MNPDRRTVGYPQCVTVRHITPMRLLRIPEPFDSDEFIFEPLRLRSALDSASRDHLQILVFLFPGISGNNKTRNQNSRQLIENAARILVPKNRDSFGLRARFGNKLFCGVRVSLTR